MARLHDLLSEDTNQFGPGTDLTISLLALLLVIALITSHLYRQEKTRNDDLAAEGEGNFKLASDAFTAGDFYVRPVTRLVDPASTDARVSRIVRDYRGLHGKYPYIFVIGHSNQIDDRTAEDRSVAARQRRNLEHALRRAVLITALMAQHLDDQERDRLVAVSTGEADLRNPRRPLSQENAWVEVVFGKEWKSPRHARAH
jgi:hypothetical protein